MNQLLKSKTEQKKEETDQYEKNNCVFVCFFFGHIKFSSPREWILQIPQKMFWYLLSIKGLFSIATYVK